MTDNTRILIVNDDEEVLFVTSRILRKAGYEVLTASTGLTCLDLARTAGPHLVLADVVMPDMNGFEVCGRIKADPDLSGMLVILFSGSRVASEDQVKGLAGGADGFITFPCGGEELLARVEAFARMQRSEQRFRESEERFRLIAETIRDVFWMTTPGVERMVYVSPAYETIWGRSRESLYESPRSFLDAVHPEDRKGLIAQIEKDTQREWECEYRVVGPDGTTRWIHDKGFPIRDKDGKLSFTTGVARDITERKQAEEALRQSEESYRELFENAIMGIFHSLPEGRFLRVNPALAAMMGFRSPDEMVSSVTDIAHQLYVDPHDRTEMLTTTLKGGWTHSEIRFRRKGGAIMTANLAIRLVNKPDGTIDYLEGFVEDVTGRKEADEEAEVMIGVLHLINAAGSPKELMQLVSAFLKKQFHCDAIGIRLKEDEDFPYFETRGFTRDFILSENSLCARNDRGEIVHGKDGEPILECFCGAVLHGRVDPAKPFLTEHGSFWTGGNTEPLARGGSKEIIHRIRNRCPAHGYESVALIPLRLGDKRLGLLQLNDRRKDVFTARTVSILERMADNLAIALARLRAEDALQRAHNELEQRVEERTAELVTANDRLNREIEERKRTEKEIQKSNALLLALSKLQSRYISGANPHILFSDILGDMLSLTGSEYGFIGEVMAASDGRRYLKMHAITEVDWKKKPSSRNEADSRQALEFYNLQTLYGAVLTDGEPVISNSPSQDPRSGGLPEGHPPMHSFLGMPLYSGGELLGMVGLANKAGGYAEGLIEYLHPLLVSFGNIIGAHRNDLGRRKAEEALAESERRFRHIYDHSPVMMSSVDEKGRLVSANLKWLEETGYDREDVIGKSLDFMMTPEPLNDEISSLLPHFCKDGCVRDTPYKLAKKDGSIIDVLFDGNVTTEPSGQRIWLNAVRNITERKRAVEQLQKSKAMLQMVFDGISEPLIMLGKDMEVRMLNRAAKDYYSLIDYRGVVGKSCFAGFRGRSGPCAECEKPLSALRGYTGSFERKGPLDPRTLERVVVYQVADQPTGEEGCIVRISDITQSRLMERQLVQSEKLASLGLLISGIAHEINNPNSFITFNIPILRDYLDILVPIIDDHAGGHSDFEPFGMSYEEFRKDIFKLVDNMEHGSSRINATISGLKEFVRKRDKVELSEVDMGQVVERAVMLCRSEIKKSVKSFQVNVPKDIAPFQSDPEAIEQVLVNLLINAVHAVDKEESWIRLEILPDDGQVRCCAIEVSDNGRGMDEATKRKIFDPFFTTNAALKGTGLGLSICHNLVEGLGGRIEVESELGKGSIFRVIL